MRSSRSSSKHSYSRSFELPEDDLNEDPKMISGAMLPIFLNDLHRQYQQDDEQDLVEVTLDIDDDSIIVRSVTPTAQQQGSREVGDGDAELERSPSITARIRRKFPWIRSGSSRASSEADEPATALSAREARKIRARLDRNRSSAQRALGGLRFISKTTTGMNDNEEIMWRKVEQRFRCLAKDGLLAREDFGECIGKKLFFHEPLTMMLVFSSVMQLMFSLSLSPSLSLCFFFFF